MALKDIFTMIKADRYTADGCEEIKKAQNAIKEETKDATPPKTIYHWKSGDYKKEGDKYIKIGPGTGGAGKGAGKTTAQRMKAYVDAMNKKNGEFAGSYKRSKAKSDAMKQEQLAELNRASSENGPDMNAEKAKHTEARKDRESAGAKQDLPADLQKQAQEYVAWEKPEVIQRYINNLRKPFSIERDSFKEPDKLAEALEVELKKKTESKPAEKKTYLNENGGRNHRAALEETPTDAYDFEKTVQKSIPMSQGDKEELQHLKSFMRDEGADYKQALRSRATNLVDGNKSNGDWYPEKEKSIMKIAKAVGYDKDLHEFIEEEFGGYDLGYSEDAAPRELTGDCKIRIRKSK